MQDRAKLAVESGGAGGPDRCRPDGTRPAGDGEQIPPGLYWGLDADDVEVRWRGWEG